MASNNEPPKGLDMIDLARESVVPTPPEKQIAVAVKYNRSARSAGKLTEQGEARSGGESEARGTKFPADEAPKIVASGRGAVAEQILQLAFANGVKVREDADLAEVLSHLELESPIPLEAYAAVAEILAYVYRANGERQ